MTTLRPQASTRPSITTRSGAAAGLSGRQDALNRFRNPSAAASLRARTSVGANTRPNVATRPQTGADVGSRIGNRPGARIDSRAGRPTSARLNDFLKQRTSADVRRPGTGNDIRRPSSGNIGRDGSRPEGVRPSGPRPGTQRPGTQRPGSNIANRDRDRSSVNRPSWGNLPGDQRNHIRNSLSTSFRDSIGRDFKHRGPGRDIAGVHNDWRGNNRNHWDRYDWRRNHPQYGQHWNNWSNSFHNHWRGHQQRWFNNNFWVGRNVNFPWWGNYYGRGGFYNGFYRPYSYWWSQPSWTGLCNWFPSYGWSTPYYYGYGAGGNVIYRDNYVYVDDQPIATTAQYAASAAELATVDPAAIDATLATDWLPLGTFALMADKDDVDAPRVVQLVVDKQGIISGTMYNKSTDKTHVVQGRVDEETQRVAFTIDDNEDVVFETGLYNLTQDETPVLVHFGAERTETFLLVRLEEPAADAASARSSINELP